MVDSIQSSGIASDNSHPHLMKLASALRMSSPFRLDEGYSEETRSQGGYDAIPRTDSRMSELMEQDPGQPTLPDWVRSLSEADRSEFAYALLRSLRTSSIAAIVDRLNPLLHLDPVLHLPPEVTFEILSYLDPQTLLRASTLSRAWRTRASDGRLWKQLFRSEGWGSNHQQVQQVQEAERARQLDMMERRTRVRRADMDSETRTRKRRAREDCLFGDGTQTPGPSTCPNGAADGPRDWVDQHGIVEADESPVSEGYDKMEDITFPDRQPHPQVVNGHDIEQEGMLYENSRGKPLVEVSLPGQPPDVPSLPVQSSLILSTRSGDPRINWQYLYKQKRRLEENWSAGRYNNFQLPHPDYSDEGHKECVYTIQYSDRYLVSGSRDQTVRIWNLETQRLVRPPLKAHEASVLCLQFDDRPDQDLIVSGGSDCQVVMWQFSTGKLIKALKRAHGESVLNLRFDDRYLVTCSKDKTIKVWNRKELLPTDDAYPTTTKSSAKFPSYIINLADPSPTQHLHIKPLPAYSLIMTLQGHSAAVNAIQILDGEIVSASGDRLVKVWDVHTGACLKTFSGHSKGIACVQFDGRRIVSGSSDETVRIFDRTTGAEVACLRGHSYLVRTVQARFGDRPGQEEDLEAEARAVDRQFFEARANGTVSAELSRERRRARNAGSRDPKDIFAYGAKLPPGGGGSRWGRIVSGSYDETVIVWKRDASGKWIIAHRLFQQQAVQNAGGSRRPRAGALPTNLPNAQMLQATQQQMQQQALQGGAILGLPTPTTPGNPGLPQAIGASQVAPQPQAQPSQTTQMAQAAQPVTVPPVNNATANNTAPTTGAGNNPGAVPVNPPTTNIPNNNFPQHPNNPQPHQPFPPHHHPHHHHHHHHHHHNPGHVLVPGANPGAHPHQQGAAGPPGMNSRVFKLQFDSRRIICCSQDPTIVGWDFANGDPDIVQASRFFGPEG